MRWSDKNTKFTPRGKNIEVGPCAIIIKIPLYFPPIETYNNIDILTRRNRLLVSETREKKLLLSSVALEIWITSFASTLSSFVDELKYHLSFAYHRQLSDRQQYFPNQMGRFLLGKHFISLSINYFFSQTIIVNWHAIASGRNSSEEVERKTETREIHKHFSQEIPIFQKCFFSVCIPKNKSSRLLRICVEALVNLVNLPSKHCLIVSLKLFQTLTCVFPLHGWNFSGFSVMKKTTRKNINLSRDWHWNRKLEFNYSDFCVRQEEKNVTRWSDINMIDLN